MRLRIFVVAITAFCAAAVTQAESTTSCAKLANFRMDGVEITKAALIPAGATVPPAYPGAPSYRGPCLRTAAWTASSTGAKERTARSSVSASRWLSRNRKHGMGTS